MTRRHSSPLGLELGIIVVLTLVLLPLSSFGAPIQEVTELQQYSESCYYNYNHYNEGDRILTNEPCLNCTCHNRMLMCYLRVCPFTKPIGHDCVVEKREDQCCPIITCPEVPVDISHHHPEPGTELSIPEKYGCNIDAKFYPEGAQVPSNPNKPCELCYCIRNRTSCLMQECTLHIDGCQPIYNKGSCCPVRYNCDHENELLEIEGSSSITTERPTEGFLLTTTSSPLVSSDCVHNGEVYADGTSITGKNACEHCYCMRGDIVCAVQECKMPFIEAEGKTCSSLPPAEGECCPSNYVCEEDKEEKTTTAGIESDISTTLDQEATTVQPPKSQSDLHGSVSEEDVQLQEHIDDVQSTKQDRIDDGIADSTETPLLEGGDYQPKDHVKETTTIPLPSEEEAIDKHTTEVALDATTGDEHVDAEHISSTESSEKEESLGATATYPAEGTTSKKEVVELESEAITSPALIDTVTDKKESEEESSSISDEELSSTEPFSDLTEQPPKDYSTEDEGLLPTLPPVVHETSEKDIEDVTTASPVEDFTDKKEIEDVPKQETEGPEGEDLITSTPSYAQGVTEKKETTILHLIPKDTEVTDKDIPSSEEVTTTHYRHEDEKPTTALYPAEEDQTPRPEHSPEEEISSSTSYSVEDAVSSTETPYEHYSTEKPSEEEKDIDHIQSETTLSPFEEVSTIKTKLEEDSLTSIIEPSTTVAIQKEAESTVPTKSEEDIKQYSEEEPQEGSGTEATATEGVEIEGSGTKATATESVEMEGSGGESSGERLDEVIPFAIPGEGDCLVEENTYKNNSIVPLSSECDESCMCISSIVICKQVKCEKPSNLEDCIVDETNKGLCCPSYVCGTDKLKEQPTSTESQIGEEIPMTTITPVKVEEDEVIVDESEESDKPTSSETVFTDDQPTTSFPVRIGVIDGEESKDTTLRPLEDVTESQEEHKETESSLLSSSTLVEGLVKEKEDHTESSDDILSSTQRQPSVDLESTEIPSKETPLPDSKEIEIEEPIATTQQSVPEDHIITAMYPETGDLAKDKDKVSTETSAEDLGTTEKAPTERPTITETSEQLTTVGSIEEHTKAPKLEEGIAYVTQSPSSEEDSTESDHKPTTEIDQIEYVTKPVSVDIKDLIESALAISPIDHHQAIAPKDEQEESTSSDSEESILSTTESQEYTPHSEEEGQVSTEKGDAEDIAQVTVKPTKDKTVSPHVYLPPVVASEAGLTEEPITSVSEKDIKEELTTEPSIITSTESKEDALPSEEYKPSSEESEEEKEKPSATEKISSSEEESSEHSTESEEHVEKQTVVSLTHLPEESSTQQPEKDVALSEGTEPTDALEDKIKEQDETSTSKPSIIEETSSTDTTDKEDIKPFVEEDIKYTTISPTRDEILASTGESSSEEDLSTSSESDLSSTTIKTPVDIATQETDADSDYSTVEPSLDKVSPSTDKPSIDEQAIDVTDKSSTEDEVSTKQPLFEKDLSIDHVVDGESTVKPLDEEEIPYTTSSTKDEEASVASTHTSVDEQSEILASTEKSSAEEITSDEEKVKESATLTPSLYEELPTKTEQPSSQTEDESYITTKPSFLDKEAGTSTSIDDISSYITAKPSIDDELASSTELPSDEESLSKEHTTLGPKPDVFQYEQEPSITEESIDSEEQASTEEPIHDLIPSTIKTEGIDETSATDSPIPAYDTTVKTIHTDLVGKIGEDIKDEESHTPIYVEAATEPSTSEIDQTTLAQEGLLYPIDLPYDHQKPAPPEDLSHVKEDEPESDKFPETTKTPIDIKEQIPTELPADDSKPTEKVSEEELPHVEVTVPVYDKPHIDHTTQYPSRISDIGITEIIGKTTTRPAEDKESSSESTESEEDHKEFSTEKYPINETEHSEEEASTPLSILPPTTTIHQYITDRSTEHPVTTGESTTDEDIEKEYSTEKVQVTLASVTDVDQSEETEPHEDKSSHTTSITPVEDIITEDEELHSTKLPSAEDEISSTEKEKISGEEESTSPSSTVEEDISSTEKDIGLLEEHHSTQSPFDEDEISSTEKEKISAEVEPTPASPIAEEGISSTEKDIALPGGDQSSTQLPSAEDEISSTEKLEISAEEESTPVSPIAEEGVSSTEKDIALPGEEQHSTQQPSAEDQISSTEKEKDDAEEESTPISSIAEEAVSSTEKDISLAEEVPHSTQLSSAEDEISSTEKEKISAEEESTPASVEEGISSTEKDIALPAEEQHSTQLPSVEEETSSTEKENVEAEEKSTSVAPTSEEGISSTEKDIGLAEKEQHSTQLPSAEDEISSTEKEKISAEEGSTPVSAIAEEAISSTEKDVTLPEEEQHSTQFPSAGDEISSTEKQEISAEEESTPVSPIAEEAISSTEKDIVLPGKEQHSTQLPSTEDEISSTEKEIISSEEESTPISPIAEEEISSTEKDIVLPGKEQHSTQLPSTEDEISSTEKEIISAQEESTPISPIAEEEISSTEKDIGLSEEEYHSTQLPSSEDEISSTEKEKISAEEESTPASPIAEEGISSTEKGIALPAEEQHSTQLPSDEYEITSTEKEKISAEEESTPVSPISEEDISSTEKDIALPGVEQSSTQLPSVEDEISSTEKQEISAEEESTPVSPIAEEGVTSTEKDIALPGEELHSTQLPSAEDQISSTEKEKVDAEEESTPVSPLGQEDISSTEKGIGLAEVEKHTTQLPLAEVEISSTEREQISAEEESTPLSPISEDGISSTEKEITSDEEQFSVQPASLGERIAPEEQHTTSAPAIEESVSSTEKVTDAVDEYTTALPILDIEDLVGKVEESVETHSTEKPEQEDQQQPTTLPGITESDEHTLLHQQTTDKPLDVSPNVTEKAAADVSSYTTTEGIAISKENKTQLEAKDKFHSTTLGSILSSSQAPTMAPPHYQPPSYGQTPQYPSYSEDEYTDEDETEVFGPGTCRYGGKLFVSAQQIPRDDPCDFCFCFRSDIICLQQSCPPPISGCHEEPIQGFCCPRYECPVSMATVLNITTSTTTTSTTLPPHFLHHAYNGAAEKNGCHIQGKSYKVGDKIDSASGPCMHCTCGGDGQMKCDPKTCTPEPMLRQMIAVVASQPR